MAFYFCLGNLPRKKRSPLASINLLILCPAYLISKYSYERILRPLIDDLLRLESGGIEIDVCCHKVALPGSVAMLIGDNLAQHALFFNRSPRYTGYGGIVCVYV